MSKNNKNVDMIKSFVFKNTATVYAYSIEEAKQYLFDNLKIDNNVKELRRIAEEESQFNSLKYLRTFTEDDVNSIVEVDYDSLYAYIELDEILLEDAPRVYDVRPLIKPKGLISLPVSVARKYDSYKEKMRKIEIPSISYWTI